MIKSQPLENYFNILNFIKKNKKFYLNFLLKLI